MSATPQSNPRQPEQKILVRGVNWLGDAVMSTPALLRLREAHPGARITLLTPEKLKDLWHQHPAIDQVLTFAPKESVWQLGRRLKAEGFDLALVFPNSPRSALEIWLSGARERVGYSRPWRNFFLTRKVSPRAEEVKMQKRSLEEINELNRQAPRSASGNQVSPRSHHIHQYLHLTAAIGGNPDPLPPSLAVADEAITKLMERFRLGPVSSATSPWLGLNAGAEYGPAKRWPEDRFAAAASQIQKLTGGRWLIFGLKNDAPTAARITAHLQQAAREQFGAAAESHYPVNLAGVTTLIELCAALKLCRAVVTNDSGPMHVAAALGTPVIVPFGSTSPVLTGPGLPGDSHHRCLQSPTACAPCFLRTCPIDFRCMLGISTEQVVNAVLDVLRPG